MRTIKTYVGEVGRTVYPVDFDLGYLDRSHVFVYTGDVPTEQLTYTWPNANQIELTVELPAGVEFKIRRITPRHELFNDYENGAILEERNLDDSFKQTLMVLEEWEDGSYPDGLKMLNDIDMQGHRILNLPRPVLPHEPLRLQDVDIDVSLIVPDSEFALIRSTIEPTPLNGKMWFNKESSLYVGDEGVWKPVGSEGTQTGGGIVYESNLPVEIVEGVTYFDADKMEHVYSYNDGANLHYLAVPLLTGSSAAADVGGGGGGDEVTFLSASVNGASLVAASSVPAAHKVKSLLAGTGMKTTSTGTEVTLNVDMTNTAAVTGQSLLVATDGTTGAKLQVKKLRQGTNITLASDGESVTISSTGGTGSGGIVYAEDLPVDKVVGTTYFDHAKAELVTTFDDGSSVQYLAYPMNGFGANFSGSGGGTGESFTFVQLGTAPDGATFYTFDGVETYSFKRIKAGASATVRMSETATSIVVDALDVVSPVVSGASLVDTKTTTTQPIKRIVAGANVTLNETATAVTINAATGGGTLGDTLTRLDSISAVNNNIPVFTALGATQFLSTASTRAMMGLSTVGNTIPMFTGSSSATIVTLTPYMVSMLEKTGIPTALAHLGITSGSNANGEWLRIATGGSGGIQICWHTIVCDGAVTTHGAGFIGSTATWTYPQAFAAPPRITPSISDGVAAMVINGATGYGTSNATFRQLAFVASVAAAVGVVAVGYY